MMLNLLPVKSYAEQNFDSTNIASTDNGFNIHYIDADTSDGIAIYELISSTNTFKIIENIEEDYKSVDAQVFVLQSDGSYTPLYESKSIMNSNGVDVYTYKGVSVKTEHIGINPFMPSGGVNPNIDLSNGITPLTSTPWEYVDTTYGSNQFQNFIISLVVQVIIAVACASKKVSPAIETAAKKIADYIVSHLLKTVYYAMAYFEKRSLDVSWVMVTGTMYITTYYSDPGRRIKIDLVRDVVDLS